MKNLALLRKKKGLTQMQLAKLIGVSTSTVAMWETGQRKPDRHTVIKLHSFINYTLYKGKLQQKRLKVNARFTIFLVYFRP